MILCGEFGISVTEFWQSTPNEFNGLLRGAYQKVARDSSLILPLYRSKRKLKLKDILGFELTEHEEGFGTEKASSANVLEQFDSLEEKIEYKRNEIRDLFDSFD